MSTPAPLADNLPTSPNIPLSDAQRAAYVDLYNKLETQYQSTADPVVLGAVGPQRDNVKEVLTKDDMYKLSQDDAIFQAQIKQIGITNDGLKTLQTQMASTASHFQMAADIAGAITRVLGLMGAL